MSHGRSSEMTSRDAFEHEYLLYLMEVRLMAPLHARSLILKNEAGEYIASRTADAWAIWQRAAKWGAS